MRRMTGEFHANSTFAAMGGTAQTVTGPSPYTTYPIVEPVARAKRTSGAMRTSRVQHNHRLPERLDVGIGNRRQLLNMITDALGVNALSMHVHRNGLAPPQAA